MNFTPEQAKQFFISIVVEEASRSGVTLSPAEQAMLGYGEGHPLPEEVVGEFERQTTDEEFEEKVISLLRSAYIRDKDSRSHYREAIQGLRGEDHYIRVMVDGAFQNDIRFRSPRDIALLFGSAFVIVLVLLLAIWIEVR